MSTVAHMATPKKSEKPAEDAAGGKKNVKVSPEFHRRLKIVAAFVQREMGDIVERELEEFLAREEALMKKPRG